MFDPKWFFGVVEDINDPTESGKVAVRIFGVHNPDPTILPTEFLPWGKLLQMPTNAAHAGLGASPTGITVGSHVVGFALDDSYNDIRICFTWHGGSDVNPMARGLLVKSIERKNYNRITDVEVKQPLPEEPTSGGPGLDQGIDLTPTPAATASDTDVDPETWMAVARKEEGVKEYSGKFNNNPRILEYNKATSLGASEDEVSWCAAFVGWCLIQAGYKGTRSAMARSYLSWGSPLSAPRFGAIVVFSRGGNPIYGHVSFVQKFDDNYVWCLGGNQSDSVKVSRFSRASVLGYRWPSAVQQPAAEVAEQNGTWSEPVVTRSPTIIATPAPSGNVVDEDNTGQTVSSGGGSSTYPYNHPFVSWSGHIVEVDDSPDAERLHWMHRSGSYKEMLPDGDVVNKSVKDHMDITAFDKKYYVGRNHNQTVKGYEVQRKTGEAYHLYGTNHSQVIGGTYLLKVASTTELQVAGILRFIVDGIEMSGTLRLPLIEVDEIRCNTLNVANPIEGTVAYAKTAGVAGSLGGATPVQGNGPGNITVQPSLEDNGGNFAAAGDDSDGDDTGSEASSTNKATATATVADTSSAADDSATDVSSVSIISTLPDAVAYKDKAVLYRAAGATGAPKWMYSDGTIWSGF